MNGGPLVVCVGDALVDILAFVPELPDRGGASWSPPPARFAGGTGANVAAGLANLGMRAAFAGRVGEDEHGRFLAEDMERRGIGTSLLAHDPKAGTGIAFGMVEPGGERTFVACAEGAAHTRLARGDIEGLEKLSPAAVFVTGLLLLEEPSRGAVIGLVERLRGTTPIYFDPNLRQPGSETMRLVRDAMRGVAESSTVVLANEDEMASLAPASARNRLFVTKRGGEGALLEKQGGEIFEVHGHAVEAVDTTGAGDAFDAAFIAARMRGFGDEEALGVANAAAALSVTRPGARTMPEWEEAVRLWMTSEGDAK